jgi:2-polyprenyl-3-methyl-5-hydroxy-6-metoxy-1,4-benzoquinol methylase
MQSITWEEIRTIFTPEFKANTANQDAINNTWRAYKSGTITLDEARKQIEEKANVAEGRKPAWAGRSDSGDTQGSPTSTYREELPGGSVSTAERGGADEGRGGDAAGEPGAGDRGGVELPPAENSQKTQVTTTTGSYRKAAARLDDLDAPEGKILDFGAGRGLGSEAMGADSFEPFPREGFNPTYTDAKEIPDDSYSRIVNLNVLNVVPPDIRADIVQDIGRILKPGGVAIIGTRRTKGDVANTKHKTDMSHIEPDAITTSSGTYQKGLEPAELVSYLQEQLGDGFEVTRNTGIAASGAIVKKKD